MTEVYRPPGWKQVAKLFDGMNKSDLPDVRSWLEERALRLKKGWAESSPAAVTILSNWYPQLTGKASEVLAHHPSSPVVRLAVAREHGFPSWAAVQQASNQRFDVGFESAVDMMLNGDLVGLRRGLRGAPDLVRARSPFGHQATLLHYIAANGVETERQITPSNAEALVTLLLESGSDPTVKMPVYGGEFTTLELLRTSAHPAAAGVSSAVAKLLGPV